MTFKTSPSQDKQMSNSIKSLLCGVSLIVSSACLSPSYAADEATTQTTSKIDLGASAKPITTDAETLAMKDKVIAIMKAYLLENPEFMLEVQSALLKKQDAELKIARSKFIKDSQDIIYNNKDDIVLGNPKGTKTIVEFFDYNCGYCKKNYPDIMKILKEDKNVRLVLKDLPILSEDSAKAHIVARAFYALMPKKINSFFEKMIMSSNVANEANAIKVAISLGANKKALLQKMKDPKITNILIENSKLAYQLKINGTPAYIIKDALYPGALFPKELKEKLK